MIDFPSSPSVGQVFTAAGASWRWDGTKWVAYGGGSSGDVGRNQLHNSTFEVRQRGLGSFTTDGAYTADRWQMNRASDTASFSLVQSVIGATGDEAIYWVLNNTFTGNAAATAFNQIGQKIENLLRLSGKTVTVSFYAVASATLKLGCNIYQYFGTGGSPSAGAWVQATGNAATLSTSWQRFSFTYVIPSVAGKTLGSNNDHFTHLLFGYSAGANTSPVYGNIGVQSGTIYISGVQLEIGSVMTTLEKPDPQQDLARCQRFYQGGYASISSYGVPGWGYGLSLPFQVGMRATPTMTIVAGTPSYANAGSASISANNAASYTPQAQAAATGSFAANWSWTASADL